MKQSHPGDFTLQRYRNRTLNEAAARIVREHLSECAGCRQLDLVYECLEYDLSALPDVKPAHGFTDRVMAQLPDVHDGVPRDTAAGARRPLGRARFWRPELTNTMVAAAATYLFVSSGLLDAFFTLSPDIVEFRLLSTAAELLAWLDRLAQVLQT